jgi:NAD(P)H dehydrogenase (quinone)
MSKILITGASGLLGKEVVNGLIQKTGSKNLSVLVRDPLKVAAFQEKGVEVLQGDYNDLDSLLATFKGVEKLFFVSGNDIPNRLKQHENVVTAAKKVGVKHIIYTSFQRKTEDGSSPIALVADAHIKTELLVKASGITYTILKHALYADMIPMFAGDKITETGVIYLPAGDGKVSYATRTDLAAGAIAILSTSGHENKTYEFSGKHSYSFEDIAVSLSKLFRKPIIYNSPSVEEYKETLKRANVPAEIIGMVASFSAGIKNGEFDFPDKTLSELIGRDTMNLDEIIAGFYKMG